LLQPSVAKRATAMAKLQIVFILILTKIRTNATVTLITTGQQGTGEQLR
jgi:hypothetical protein